MTILHTADWHLGKYLDKFSRLSEQQEVIEQIIRIADEHEVDAVVVSGDLFDSFNPSNEASELLYSSLHRLTNQGKRAVVAIAGNHDSPERVDMPDVLARVSGILFVGMPMAEAKPFETSSGLKTLRIDKGFVELQLPACEFPLRLVLTPYANELRLKKYLGNENREENLRLLLQNHWTTLAEAYCDDKGVNMLVTHLFMMQKGGEQPEEPEGEKAILVGGSQPIFTENIPPQVQYVALGHLHRSQNLGTDKQPVVYSGSPLAYSFAESEQKKYVHLIYANPGEPVSKTRVELKQKFPLLQNKFENIDEAVAWLESVRETYVQITITVEKYLSAADKRRINDAHDRIVNIIPEITGGITTLEKQMVNINEHSMETLFEQFFQSKKGVAPDGVLKDLFKEVLNSEDQDPE
jgi:exonuclease SbcD